MKLNGNTLENGVRLGLAKTQKDGPVMWTPGNRPREYPPRDPQNRPWLVDEINMRGTCKARILRSCDDWLDSETDHPCKLLSLTVEISEVVKITDYADGKPVGNQLERRRRIWKIPLEGENLTEKTAWLTALDIVSICHGEVVFCNGYKLTAKDGGECVASFETLPKEDGDKTWIPAPPEQTQKTGQAGKSVFIDGELFTIENREWKEEQSPELITHNGRELPPTVITRHRCIFDIRKLGGEVVRLVVVPPFRVDQAHWNPIAVETITPVTYENGLGGTGTLNALVKFAEHRPAERCLVEFLPQAKPTAQAGTKKPTVKRAITVTQAARDFNVSRPTINKWESGKGNPPENFTLSDVKIYALCLKTHGLEKRFNDHVIEGLKCGQTINGKQKYARRIIARGDIGQGRETDYQQHDPTEE